MTSSSLLTAPTTKPTPPLPPKPVAFLSSCRSTAAASTASNSSRALITGRRELALSAMTAAWAAPLLLLQMVPTPPAAFAESDDEYVKETKDVINKLRTTINMDKKDPNVAEAVAELRDASNSWVAKFRREKTLLGRPSFRDMYSALNAVSGHYISFGPTAPIPAKRKTRILEEVETAEKALLRGR